MDAAESKDILEEIEKEAVKVAEELGRDETGLFLKEGNELAHVFIGNKMCTDQGRAMVT